MLKFIKLRFQMQNVIIIPPFDTPPIQCYHYSIEIAYLAN